MPSKYVDTSSIIQVIGTVFKNPSLLDQVDRYVITDEDFDKDFHKVVFGAIYKIHELGAEQVTLENINDFLQTRPKSLGIYTEGKGDEWLLKASEVAELAAFDYYYGRLKKMSLLRAFDSYGIDVRDLYDPDNIFDTQKRQKQEDFLDNSSLEDIVTRVNDKIETIKYKYVDGANGSETQAGDGVVELVERLEVTPEVGIPLYGPLINTITRGARLKKFYLRSAPTGTGKSRTMIADACTFSCGKIYDETFGWITNGSREPTLFITTEQEVEEVQTMMLSFLANVNEEHILNGKYEGDERNRILRAAELLKEAPLYIEELPDFSLQDIENTIKKNIRDYDVKYVVLDYIHTSMKILEEITRRSGGVKLREDNILFMLSIRLKDICNQYGIFVLSATQLNSDYQTSSTPDQNLLRGAKSIADKIDMGSVLLPVKQTDLDKLDAILSNSTFQTPNLKLSIYKNRRGKYKGIYLWCDAHLECCRVKPIFCTTYDYELIKVDDLKIITDDESAF